VGTLWKACLPRRRDETIFLGSVRHVLDILHLVKLHDAESRQEGKLCIVEGCRLGKEDIY